ncbi:MAG: DDE-type integrase/transposase/recombinase, partial [Bacteroidota bacterium]|nr:DDE-type integrase/transposase/recombinase [Bacteroidota bacterium]
MRSYNSYHTCIKQLARTNCLPGKYATSIDRSTIWRWKQEKEDKYLGYELTTIEALQQFLERRESETILRSYLKLILVFSSLIRKSSQINTLLSQNKEILVRTSLRYKQYIKISFILRLLNLSPSVFYHWKNQILYPCKTSALQLCRRIYPNQLTEGEVLKIKSMLNSQEFKYWPISSIAHYARRSNILHLSLATWYNYIRKPGIKRPALPKKIKYKTGIRADHPHQIWHADITIVKCLNGMKYYVYLLMDNYSRYILNYQVSEKVSARIRLDSIRQACQDFLIEYLGETTLLVDGGSENNNLHVDQYKQSQTKSIRKLIAGKDIRFS